MGFVNPLCIYVADLEPAHDCMCSLVYPGGYIARQGFAKFEAVYTAHSDQKPCLHSLHQNSLVKGRLQQGLSLSLLQIMCFYGERIKEEKRANILET